MGCGKTTCLRTFVRAIRMEKPDVSILSISFRQGLSWFLASTYDLNCYLEPGWAMTKSMQKRCVVCINSLAKLEPTLTWDLVILDEGAFTQFQLVSSIMKERGKCLETLEKVLKEASQICLMQYLIPEETINFYCNLLGVNSNDRNTVRKYKVCVPQPCHDVFSYSTLQDILVVALIQYCSYFNYETRQCDLPFVIFSTKVDAAIIVHVIFTSMEKNLRKKSAEGSEDYEEQVKLNLAEKSRILLVCSETKLDSSVKNFFNNPREESLKYDVVIATTVIQAGVSLDTYFSTAYDLVFIGVLAQRDLDQFLQRWRFLGRNDILLQRHTWIQQYSTAKKKGLTFEKMKDLSGSDDQTIMLLQVMEQVSKERTASFINVKRTCKFNNLLCDALWVDILREKRKNENGTLKELTQTEKLLQEVISELWNHQNPLNRLGTDNIGNCFKAIDAFLSVQMKDIAKKQGESVKLFFLQFGHELRGNFDSDFIELMLEQDFLISRQMYESLLERGGKKVSNILNNEVLDQEKGLRYVGRYLKAKAYVKDSDESFQIKQYFMLQFFLDYLLYLHPSGLWTQFWESHTREGEKRAEILGKGIVGYIRLLFDMLVACGCISIYSHVLSNTCFDLGNFTKEFMLSRPAVQQAAYHMVLDKDLTDLDIRNDIKKRATLKSMFRKIGLFTRRDRGKRLRSPPGSTERPYEKDEFRFRDIQKSLNFVRCLVGDSKFSLFKNVVEEGLWEQTVSYWEVGEFSDLPVY